MMIADAVLTNCSSQLSLGLQVLIEIETYAFDCSNSELLTLFSVSIQAIYTGWIFRSEHSFVIE